MAGGKVALALALPVTARRPLGAALRARRRVTAKIEVVASDAAGNRTTRSRTVAITR